MGIELIRKSVKEEPKGPGTFRPFEKIAVTFSGGGFRASAFALGCLSYLQHRKYENVTLLERVKFVAASSSGALTAILFAASNKQGRPFSEIYNHLRKEVLPGDKLLKEAARIIGDDKEWKASPSKSRNTINAVAKAYQKMAFFDQRFEVFWDHSKGTLEEICINTSELENGRAFRFQTDGKEETDEMLGNKYLRIRDNNIEAVKKLRLGDILAASSCFPASFEPMIFPDDFAEDEAHKEELKKSLDAAKNYDWEEYEPFNRSFALMDGGITDNQGIESLKLANDKRRQKGKGFDLMLICDAVNYFMEPFEPLAETKNWWNRISLANVIAAHKYSVLVLIPSLVLIFTGHWVEGATVAAIISSIMFGLFVFGTREFRIKPRESKAAATGTGQQEHRNKPEVLWSLPLSLFSDFFIHSSIYSALQLMKVRIRSSFRVAMEIYLLQIRRINYDSLYSNPEWAFKTKAVSIYELSKSNENVLQRQFERKKFNKDLIALLTPSGKMMAVADYAREMDTTLWFSTGDMMGKTSRSDAIIACGQFTMCYNLLEYIIQIEEYYPEITKDVDIQKLKSELLEDWKKFKEDPEFMVEG